MIFIDDVIEGILVTRHRAISKSTNHERRLSIVGALIRLDDVFQRQRTQTYEAELMDFLLDYLARHPDRARFDNGDIVYTATDYWSPNHGYRALLKIDIPVPPKSELTQSEDTQLSAESTPSPVEQTLTVTHDDKLPVEITKPSEAWAWWLQQPDQLDKYWRSKQIVEGILSLSKRFSTHQLKGVAIAMSNMVERHNWSIEIEKRGRGNVYGVARSSEHYSPLIEASMANGGSPEEKARNRLPSVAAAPEKPPEPSEATPSPTEPANLFIGTPEQLPSTDDPVEVDFRKYCVNVDGESAIIDIRRPDPLKTRNPRMFKEYLPPGRVAKENRDLWDTTAHMIQSNLKQHCFRTEDFWFFLFAIVDQVPNLDHDFQEEQMQLLLEELLEQGWIKAVWGGDYGGHEYIGPRRLMSQKQLHDHVDYIRWREWSESTKDQ